MDNDAGAVARAKETLKVVWTLTHLTYNVCQCVCVCVYVCVYSMYVCACVCGCVCEKKAKESFQNSYTQNRVYLVSVCASLHAP
jgi:hypothetical protein